MKARLVLASASPRRAALMRQIGRAPDAVIPADADETVTPGLDPARTVALLAERKARAVQARAGGGAVIVGSDTVVALDGEILGKPAGAAEAAAMLRRLSGRSHEVFTGLCVLAGEEKRACVGRAEVTFRALGEDEIAAYVAGGEPMDKAGAYGIQGRAAAFVEGIRGDYYSVVGLPVCRLAEFLRELAPEAEIRPGRG